MIIMKITLKDGSVKEYAESKSVYEIALDISEGLARAACAGEVNGEVVDLRTVVSEDCELKRRERACRTSSHGISCSCRGSKEIISGGKTCNRTFHRYWILL